MLVVHSDGDRLFPLSMAERVVKACGDRGEAIIVNGLEHNAPIFAASEAYWGPVAEWAKRLAGPEAAIRGSEDEGGAASPR